MNDVVARSVHQAQAEATNITDAPVDVSLECSVTLACARMDLCAQCVFTTVRRLRCAFAQCV